MNDFHSYRDYLGNNSTAIKELELCFDQLDSYGISSWIEFDPCIVRGLTYYTGIVFECFDRNKQFRAICGGGRYDKILEDLGHPPIPAVGFGFGDAVILEILKAKKLLPEIQTHSDKLIVFPMDDHFRKKANQIAIELRKNNFNVDMILDEKKLKWVLNRADKQKIGTVIILGENEDIQGSVSVKLLDTGEQKLIKYQCVVQELKNILLK